jgi:hypothetical protein
MARGEGTVLLTPHRQIVFSDFDIAIVVPAPADARRLRPVYTALSRSLSQMLQLGPCAHVDLGCIPLTMIRRPPAAIFFIELRRHAKLLWGDPAVLDEMPSIDPGVVPVSDILTLVHNRTIEHLRTIGADLSLPAQSLQLYSQCKAHIDSVTARLMLAGRYESQYQLRLTACNALLPEEPAEDAARRHAWFNLKLAGEIEPFEQRWGGDLGSPAFSTGLRAEQERVAELLFELWRSTATALLTREISDIGLLADEVLRQQWSANAWLRGWYRFCRAGVGLPRLRRIAEGTPELLTYLTAVMLSRALPAYRRGDAAELASWLDLASRYYPLARSAAGPLPARWSALHQGLTRLHSLLIMHGKLN